MSVIRHHLFGTNPVNKGFYVTHWKDAIGLHTEVMYFNGERWPTNIKILDNYGPFYSFNEAAMWNKQNGDDLIDPVKVKM